MRDNYDFDRERAALILVDIQHDFLPGGALAVEEGDMILEPVRALIEQDRFGLHVATQDWHPAGHVSFASSHAGLEPFQSMTLHGHQQTLWPDHCVQGTRGAELHPSIPWGSTSAIIRKGADPLMDSYSGFRNNWNAAGERPPTGLAGYLRERGIRQVAICGLARDFCVKWTAEDAVASGFEATVIWDLSRPVDPFSNERVRSELLAAGVRILTLA